MSWFRFRISPGPLSFPITGRGERLLELTGLKQDSLFNSLITKIILKILSHFSGFRPQESKGSIIRVPVKLTKEYVYGAWSVVFAQVNSENVRLRVTPPADAVVGRYQFYVETKSDVPGTEKQPEFRYQYPEEMIVLFNPWCKG